MPVGKRKLRVHLDKERIPKPCCSTVWGFFFSFILAKHLVGYLLSLSLLSSHLQMRWQITPAKTATTKEITISIWTPPPCCQVSVRQDRNYNIPQFSFLPFSSKSIIKVCIIAHGSIPAFRLFRMIEELNGTYVIKICSFYISTEDKGIIPLILL